MSPPVPPLQPITARHIPALPDLFLTAFSVCCLLFPSKAISFPSCPRRFLKFSSMSLPPQTLKTLRSRSFNTPQSLSEWLKPRLPSDSFASWGVKPGTKNVHNLWLELAEGETSLADSDPPVRTVQVVTVRVIDKHSRVLIESRQELSDGSTRDRYRPLSEKMRPTETPESAAHRAVKEELGQIIKEENESVVKIIPGSYRKTVEERNSASYPGLPACYVLHSVDMVVEGLPEVEFCTEEDGEYHDCEENRMAVAGKAVSVKKHYWEWVSADSIK